MESESESRASRPRYPPGEEPRYARAYSQYPPRESRSQTQTPYPPREAHPSYADAARPAMRRQSSSSSYGGITRRRNSDHSRSESDQDVSEAIRPEADLGDRPAKRSRRENEHAREDEHSDPE
ncbi:hypothetical protein OPQ81_004564 [Rhizoctonia solani]|nr:hypothetical protein OPQ81_004564 [Rhizoctonia solani]